MTLSLFIPRIANNISQEKMKEVFWYLGYGKVSYVEQQFQPTSRYGRAYVYFEYWFDTPFSKNFQESVKDPSEKTMVVYDAPWYWIVTENKKHLNFKDEDENEELELLLNEMDEVEAFIPEATTSFVSTDYVEMLEGQVNDYHDKQLYLFEKIKDMEQERVELQTELAHMKELLNQYEPDKRRQNKELYEF